jgi:hypothetical protein
MFKPVRIVATAVFLAMIVMIFISAFVLDNGTLCISEFFSFVTASGTLLKRGIQSSSYLSTSRSSGTRYRTFPMRALPFSKCSGLHDTLTPPRNHHTYHPYPALVRDADHSCSHEQSCFGSHLFV